MKVCTGCTFPHKPENYGRIVDMLKAGKEAPRYDAPYHHGGELSGRENIRLDFSVNVNPLGVPASVRNVLGGLLSQSDCGNALAPLARYPDAVCTKLRRALAGKVNLPEDFILFGNGASELIMLVVAALEPRNALLLAPSFSGYERALRSHGAKIFYHYLRRENNFALQEAPESLCFAGLDMIFLCNPNNPVGNCIDPELLERFAGLCEERNIFLVVDECFLGFAADGESRSLVRLVPSHPHLIVIDAFTKRYAIPSLRLGYAFSSHAMLFRKMQALQAEWSVSLPAQTAGLAALAEDGYLAKARSLIIQERAYMARELAGLSFTVYDGVANFILFSSLGEDAGDVELYEKLLQRGMLIRSCANFHGLGDRDYRIAIRKHAENEMLINALRDIRGLHG